MKMKAVCEASGLTDRTVRYYTEEQLIFPAYTENYFGRKQFDFSESDVQALKDIAVLRKFGFSICEIKDMMQDPHSIPSIVESLKKRKQEQIEMENEQLQALQQLENEHSGSVSELASCLIAPTAKTPLPKEDVSTVKWVLLGSGNYIAIRMTLIAIGCALYLIMKACFWLFFNGLLIFLMVVHIFSIEQTETTNLADYGIYNGTYSDEFTQAYVESIFPEEILPSFSNVKYSYKAKKFDTYAFEAYLEFTVEDSEEFAKIIREIAPEEKWEPFPFDESFMEYNIENDFEIHYRSLEESTAEQGFAIQQAKIRKILYSSETQTIIYFALGVYDGGGVGTDFLCVFFERFSIDPVEYQALAVSPVRGDPYAIEVGDT